MLYCGSWLALHERDCGLIDRSLLTLTLTWTGSVRAGLLGRLHRLPRAGDDHQGVHAHRHRRRCQGLAVSGSVLVLSGSPSLSLLLLPAASARSSACAVGRVDWLTVPLIQFSVRSRRAAALFCAH